MALALRFNVSTKIGSTCFSSKVNLFLLNNAPLFLGKLRTFGLLAYLVNTWHIFVDKAEWQMCLTQSKVSLVYPKAPLPTTLIFSYFSIDASKRFRRLLATCPQHYRTQRGTKRKAKKKTILPNIKWRFTEVSVMISDSHLIHVFTEEEFVSLHSRPGPWNWSSKHQYL